MAKLLTLLVSGFTTAMGGADWVGGARDSVFQFLRMQTPTAFPALQTAARYVIGSILGGFISFGALDTAKQGIAETVYKKDAGFFKAAFIFFKRRFKKYPISTLLMLLLLNIDSGTDADGTTKATLGLLEQITSTIDVRDKVESGTKNLEEALAKIPNDVTANTNAFVNEVLTAEEAGSANTQASGREEAYYAKCAIIKDEEGCKKSLSKYSSSKGKDLLKAVDATPITKDGFNSMEEALTKITNAYAEQASQNINEMRGIGASIKALDSTEITNARIASIQDLEQATNKLGENYEKDLSDALNKYNQSLSALDPTLKKHFKNFNETKKAQIKMDIPRLDLSNASPERIDFKTAFELILDLLKKHDVFGATFWTLISIASALTVSWGNDILFNKKLREAHKEDDEAIAEKTKTINTLVKAFALLMNGPYAFAGKTKYVQEETIRYAIEEYIEEQTKKSPKNTLEKVTGLIENPAVLRNTEEVNNFNAKARALTEMLQEGNIMQTISEITMRLLPYTTQGNQNSTGDVSAFNDTALKRLQDNSQQEATADIMERAEELTEDDISLKRVKSYEDQRVKTLVARIEELVKIRRQLIIINYGETNVLNGINDLIRKQIEKFNELKKRIEEQNSGSQKETKKDSWSVDWEPAKSDGEGATKAKRTVERMTQIEEDIQKRISPTDMPDYNEEVKVAFDAFTKRLEEESTLDKLYKSCKRLVDALKATADTKDQLNLVLAYCEVDEKYKVGANPLVLTDRETLDIQIRGKIADQLSILLRAEKENKGSLVSHKLSKDYNPPFNHIYTSLQEVCNDLNYMWKKANTPIPTEKTKEDNTGTESADKNQETFNKISSIKLSDGKKITDKYGIRASYKDSQITELTLTDKKTAQYLELHTQNNAPLVYKNSKTKSTVVAGYTSITAEAVNYVINHYEDLDAKIEEEEKNGKGIKEKDENKEKTAEATFIRNALDEINGKKNNEISAFSKPFTKTSSGDGIQTIDDKPLTTKYLLDGNTQQIPDELIKKLNEAYDTMHGEEWKDEHETTLNNFLKKEFQLSDLPVLDGKVAKDEKNTTLDDIWNQKSDLAKNTLNKSPFHVERDYVTFNYMRIQFITNTSRINSKNKTAFQKLLNKKWRYEKGLTKL